MVYIIYLYNFPINTNELPNVQNDTTEFTQSGSTDLFMSKDKKARPVDKDEVVKQHSLKRHPEVVGHRGNEVKQLRLTQTIAWCVHVLQHLRRTHKLDTVSTLYTNKYWNNKKFPPSNWRGKPQQQF